LTPAEAVELQSLQQAMLKYRNKVAPLPIAAVRKLHDELLAKAGRAHSAK
jgi:DNA-directed RNA polymerase subunit F